MYNLHTWTNLRDLNMIVYRRTFAYLYIFCKQTTNAFTHLPTTNYTGVKYPCFNNRLFVGLL